VVGAPAPVIGEIGVGFVVPLDSCDPPELAELRSWAREHLADYKAPDLLVLQDELPLTPMAKVDSAALRAVAARIRERNKTIMSAQPYQSATFGGARCADGRRSPVWHSQTRARPAVPRSD